MVSGTQLWSASAKTEMAWYKNLAWESTSTHAERREELRTGIHSSRSHHSDPASPTSFYLLKAHSAMRSSFDHFIGECSVPMNQSHFKSPVSEYIIFSGF